MSGKLKLPLIHVLIAFMCERNYVEIVFLICNLQFEKLDPGIFSVKLWPRFNGKPPMTISFSFLC